MKMMALSRAKMASQTPHFPLPIPKTYGCVIQDKPLKSTEPHFLSCAAEITCALGPGGSIPRLIPAPSFLPPGGSRSIMPFQSALTDSGKASYINSAIKVYWKEATRSALTPEKEHQNQSVPFFPWMLCLRCLEILQPYILLLQRSL